MDCVELEEGKGFGGSMLVVDVVVVASRRDLKKPDPLLPPSLRIWSSLSFSNQ